MECDLIDSQALRLAIAQNETSHSKKLDNENDDEDQFESASQLVRILQLLNSCLEVQQLVEKRRNKSRVDRLADGSA
jgi:hypothetical protein